MTARTIVGHSVPVGNEPLRRHGLSAYWSGRALGALIAGVGLVAVGVVTANGSMISGGLFVLAVFTLLVVGMAAWQRRANRKRVAADSNAGDKKSSPAP